MCAFMFNSWCPNFAGIDTFHNIPFQAGLEGMDYAVMGIPYDCGSVMRADARLGPGSVRLESFDKNQLGWSTDCQVYGGSDFFGTDYGEVPVKFGYLEPSLRIIEEFTSNIVKKGVTSIAIGGGQICTLAEVRAVSRQYGRLALIHFGAGRSVRDFGTEYDDETAVRKMVEEGLVDCSHSIQLGIRGGYRSKAEKDFGISLGMEVIPAFRFHGMKRADVIAAIKNKAGSLPCFVSIDLNFLDPAFAPGVTDPVSGGAASIDIRQIVRDIFVHLDIKATDVVGMTPAYDPGHLSAQLVHGIMVEMVCSLARRRQDQEGGATGAEK